MAENLRDVVLYVRWSFHGFLRRVAVSLPGVTINNDGDGVVAVAFWKFNHEIGGDTFPWAEEVREVGRGTLSFADRCRTCRHNRVQTWTCWATSSFATGALAFCSARGVQQQGRRDEDG